MRILYVTTISNTINAFIIPHIQQLVNFGHQVDVACNVVHEIDPTLIELGCKVHNIAFQRSPFRINNLIAYMKIKKLIKLHNYDVVHTHTPIASVIVRMACRKLKNVKVIYTAHGFHFYKGAPLINWLLFYPIERYLSKYTDVLITINKEDYDRAKKSFKAKKKEYVPGVGINIDEIEKISVNRNDKRRELGIEDDAIILISVGELNKNKNHETIIKAIANIKEPKIYYIICGEGPLEKYLNRLIKKLNLENKVIMLGYRSDVIEFLKISDIFIHPSFREGLPVALMEAMACGLPIICSNIRGNCDLITHENGGLLANPYDVNSFVFCIKKLLINVELREKFGLLNKENIKKYESQIIFNLINKIYGQQ